MSQLTRVLRLVGILVLIVGLYFAVPVSADVESNLVVRAVVSVLVFVGLALAVAAQLRSHVVDRDRRIDGLVVSIVLIVFVFALAFYIIELRHPGEVAGLRTRIDALYFAVSTMTTVGYGDIHAAGQVARGLVILQMAFNVVLVAAAAALLSNRLRGVMRARASRGRDRPAEASAEADETDGDPSAVG